MGKMNLDISGMLSGGTGMLGAIANNLKSKDTSDIENNLQDAASTQFSTGDFDNIQDQYYSTLNGIGRYGEDRFVRGIDEIAGNTLNATMSGAELGTSIYPGWGTLIGAGVGLLGGVGTGIAGRIKGRGNYEDYLSEVTSIKNLLAQNRNTAIMDTKDKNFNTMALHLGAFGGNLPIVKDVSVTNDVVTIENGGTHEENPNGGVQYGVDKEGNPNYVEEGEVIYDSPVVGGTYAFSNRLKPTKELLEELNLPKGYSNLTFAEIAEKESKESKNRPLDHISRNGVEASLSKVAILQEMVRNSPNSNIAAEGGNLYAGAGYLDIYGPMNQFAYWKDGAYDPDYLKWLNTYDIAGSKYWDDLQKYYKGRTGKELKVDRARYLGQDRKYGRFHKLMGDIYASYLQDEAAKKASPQEEGGYDFKAEMEKILNSKPAAILERYKQEVPEEEVADEILPSESPKYPRPTPDYLGLAMGLGDLFANNYYDFAEADMIGNAARNIRDVSASPIGGYMGYQPYDINYDINRIDALNAGNARAALDLTGGNAGAALGALMAYNNQATGQRGDIRRKAREYNDTRRERVAEFNSGVDRFNSQQALQAALANQNTDVQRGQFKTQEARMRDDVKTAVSRAQSNTKKSLYNIFDTQRKEGYSDAQLRWLIDKGYIPFVKA